MDKFLKSPMSKRTKRSLNTETEISNSDPVSPTKRQRVNRQKPKAKKNQVLSKPKDASNTSDETPAKSEESAQAESQSPEVSSLALKSNASPSDLKENATPPTIDAASASLAAQIDPSALLSSLPEDVQKQLSGSYDMIHMLAAKMAQQMAAATQLQSTETAISSNSSPTKDTKQSPSVKRKEQAKIERELKKKKEKDQRDREAALKREQLRIEREAIAAKKQQEKEQREREIAEKKEQERIRKEEEKKKKDDERKKLEEEKKKKEEEKKKLLDAEKRKQSRIASFFTVKKAVKSPLKNPTVEKVCDASDYDTEFLPFYLKANVHLCSVNQFSRSKEELEQYQKETDLAIKEQKSPENTVLDWLKSKRVDRGYKLKYTTVDAVDAANSATESEDHLRTILQSLPQKFISFAENYRPPYVGTFTKQVSFVADNPFFTEGTGFNYDYDSEIEWNQEDEEGEDLDADDDEEDNDSDDDDMDDFVSSDEAPAPRRLIAGPLTPSAIWNDGNANMDQFKSMEIDVLSYEPIISIDPFHDYWTIPTKPINDSNSNTSSITPAQAFAQTPDKKKKKLINTADMKPFIYKIKGTEMNQIMLVETLKKEFPQYSKEIIRNTIKEVAKRVGDKEPHKIWEINTEIWSLHS